LRIVWVVPPRCIFFLHYYLYLDLSHKLIIVGHDILINSFIMSRCGVSTLTQKRCGESTFCGPHFTYKISTEPSWILCKFPWSTINQEHVSNLTIVPSKRQKRSGCYFIFLLLIFHKVLSLENDLSGLYVRPPNSNTLYTIKALNWQLNECIY